MIKRLWQSLLRMLGLVPDRDHSAAVQYGMHWANEATAAKRKLKAYDVAVTTFVRNAIGAHGEDKAVLMVPHEDWERLVQTIQPEEPLDETPDSDNSPVVPIPITDARQR